MLDSRCSMRFRISGLFEWVNDWMADAGCQILDTRCSILDAGYSIVRSELK